VLSAFERAGLRAAAYAGASSAVISATCGATAMANEVGVRYWLGALAVARAPGNGMSEVVLDCIARWAPLLRPLLTPASPRLIIATSAVRTAGAAEQSQGARARTLGRRLLLQAARGDRSWVEAHLAPRLFDSAPEAAHRLTEQNFDAVAYASTRMLHAWTIPAWVAGAPYVDASYTCVCPALELAALGYPRVIAVSVDPGPLTHDLFAREPIPATWRGAAIALIRPRYDLATIGVEFTTATEDGLIAAYQHGHDQGNAFLEQST
jgi:hypothetical protein